MPRYGPFVGGGALTALTIRGENLGLLGSKADRIGADVKARKIRRLPRYYDVALGDNSIQMLCRTSPAPVKNRG